MNTDNTTVDHVEPLPGGEQVKPTVTVETLGSVWLIDEDNMTYLRMPKREGPRENGWGDPDQGDLADLVWHPFVDWEIAVRFDGPWLVIRTNSPGGGIIAPDALVREGAR